MTQGPTRWHDLPDHLIAARPEAWAFSDSTGIRWSYRDFDAAITAMEAVLTEAGVRAGDRVLILSENCASAVAAMFAASRLSAVAAPVNARQTEAEIARILSHCEPAAVLFTTEVSADARAHAARMGAREVSGPFGRMGLATPLGSSPDAARDIAVLLYTTGTTGTPKGVMLTHENMIFGGRTSARLRGMVTDDLIYGVLPFTHVFGLASIVTGALVIGAPVIFEPRFSVARLYEVLNQGVTLLSAVPQMHALLMQYAKEQGHDRLANSKLRFVSSGAAPLDPTWKRKAEAFYGCAIQNGYGMTETTAATCVTANRIGDPDISVGPAVSGVDVVIDETVPGGGDGMGEVVTRGPNVMKGYYRNPEETAKVLDADGWLRTGDLGRIDEHGALHILGRSKELIIHGGFNIYPPEVEAAFNDHPQVIQCAVIGRAKDGDEEVLAFVQAAPDDLPEVEDLRAFAAARLAGYKRPRHIIVATALPAAPTGKILKHKLIETFADRLV